MFLSVYCTTKLAPPHLGKICTEYISHICHFLHLCVCVLASVFTPVSVTKVLAKDFRSVDAPHHQHHHCIAHHHHLQFLSVETNMRYDCTIAFLAQQVHCSACTCMCTVQCRHFLGNQWRNTRINTIRAKTAQFSRHSVQYTGLLTRCKDARYLKLNNLI